MTLADASEHLAGEDEAQRRWFEAPRPSTLQDVVAFIERCQESWRAGGPVRSFAMRDAASDALAGNVELRDRGDARANLPYTVFPAFRGRGYASRAVRLVSAYAREALPVQALVAVIDELNVASLRVAESTGFRLEGLADDWEHSNSGPMLRYVLDL
ncbi:MAG: GNAT family N-acetyltransferase [Dehalococcoidia bacterium]|nr:GNAT family N-acetyltransferase [Dehalococcoidia bacterium]